MTGSAEIRGAVPALRYAPCGLRTTCEYGPHPAHVASRPKLPGRDARAFRQRGELRPNHVGIDRGLADPGAVAAITAGDDVLAPDQLGVAGDALGDELRMLDEVRLRLDHTGNQHLAGGQLDPLEQRPLVPMARIGGLERDRGGPRRKYDVDDVGKRHVMMV